MCGRFLLSRSPEEIARWFNVARPPPNYPPHFNIAPTQAVLTVRSNPETRERTLDALRWGLVPHWAKDLKIGYKLINAKAETVATLPSFRQAFAKRRCLIPAAGFYEWAKTAPAKTPYAIVPKDEPLFAFAGLWENCATRLQAMPPSGAGPAPSSPVGPTNSWHRSTIACR